MPMHWVNLDRTKWLLEDRRFETKFCTSGANARKKDKYHCEPVSENKLRSKDDRPREGKKQKKSGSKYEKKC